MVYQVQSLLHDYHKRNENIQAKKLVFTGVEGKDVYNITAPFEDEGLMVIAGRVEGRDTEFSEVVFFVEKNGIWEPKENTRTFSLQDPFITTIEGQLIFGGVEVSPDPTDEKRLQWRTVFYKGETIDTLALFAKGPIGMKDVRLFAFDSTHIGVFTRPQGEKGGRGKIGFVMISSLDELTVERLEAAPLVNDHFTDDEWGGVNQAFVGPNGEIRVLGHIASFDEQGDRHYYPISFVYDHHVNEITKMKIIATRKDFPEGQAKRSDLVDVLFSGGLTFLEDKKAELYVGVSDAEAHMATIPNPFLVE